MNINIINRGRRLEKISEGDLLIFPDRTEAVNEVDVNSGALYTERIVRNTKPKGFKVRIEKVCYGGNGTFLENISKDSFGKVYGYELRRSI